MKKKPVLIAMLLIIGVAAYFVISPKKETKLANPLKQTPVSDLAPAKPAGGVNPPHGQPGHRCDIAVGAPIQGVGKSAAPSPSLKPVLPVVNAPVKSPSPANASVGVTAASTPKINPPHGQPGHRCDVKTGDPLPPAGSGTSQSTSQQKQPPVSQQNNTVVPPAVSTSAKLNPAHGVAGHRCDIQVGAPLPAS